MTPEEYHLKKNIVSSSMGLLVDRSMVATIEGAIVREGVTVQTFRVQVSDAVFPESFLRNSNDFFGGRATSQELKDFIQTYFEMDVGVGAELSLLSIDVEWQCNNMFDMVTAGVDPANVPYHGPRTRNLSIHEVERGPHR